MGCKLSVSKPSHSILTMHTRWRAFDTRSRKAMQTMVEKLKTQKMEDISERSGARLTAKALVQFRHATLQPVHSQTKRRRAPSVSDDNGAAGSKRQRTEAGEVMLSDIECAASSTEETAIASIKPVSNFDSCSQSSQTNTVASPDPRVDLPVDAGNCCPEAMVNMDDGHVGTSSASQQQLTSVVDASLDHSAKNLPKNSLIITPQSITTTLS